MGDSGEERRVGDSGEERRVGESGEERERVGDHCVAWLVYMVSVYLFSNLHDVSFLESNWSHLPSMLHLTYTHTHTHTHTQGL